MFDFYGLCAKYWGESRTVAKTRVIRLVLEAGGFEPMFDVGFSHHRFLNYTQPSVLSGLPVDARFEMLAHYGICLGEN